MTQQQTPPPETMKFLASIWLLLCCLFACIAPPKAFAGPTGVVQSAPTVQQPTSLSNNLYVSLFGAYTAPNSDFGDGEYGGGLQLGYTFTPIFAAEVSSGWTDSVDGLTFQNLSGSLVLRAPSGLFVDSLTPYTLAGVGGDFTHPSNELTYHAGVGLEYQATKSFSLFGDGQHVWHNSSSDTDNWQLRAGVRMRF